MVEPASMKPAAVKSAPVEPTKAAAVKSAPMEPAEAAAVKSTTTAMDLLSTRAAARDVWRGSKKASVSPLIQFLISARAMIGDLSKWEP
jgi:hypothetical protein